MTSPILKNHTNCSFFSVSSGKSDHFRLFVRICKKSLTNSFHSSLLLPESVYNRSIIEKEGFVDADTKFYQRSGFWFCCTLLWCVVIFCFSAQDATQSNAVSNGVLHKIAEICTAWIPADAMDLESSTHTSMAFLIRKIAHFTLYFILGLLSCATMMTYCLKKNTLFRQAGFVHGHSVFSMPPQTNSINYLFRAEPADC